MAINIPTQHMSGPWARGSCERMARKISALLVGPTPNINTENEMTHHAIDALTDSGLGQEVRTAVKWLNDLSDEIGKRGLTLRIGLDPCIRINDGGGERGPYVEATVMKEVE